ncbi:uncharacterized protein LOC134436779, partial [Engraulis encrasicolus]|uniref:uncharacterized protein LOC134436779 n=1 Tax=Engraulis encrasicolus TaxID=184585 RepID=UPI002FD44686
ILATKNGAAVSYLNQNKYHISDGYLHIKEVEGSDAGEYYCNGQLEAEVEVLTGQVFSISEGRTLFIPCEGERKQVWSFKKERTSQRVNIFTVFRNGTVLRERDDPEGRFVPQLKALEIGRLRLEDSGRYLCNMKLVARLIVLKVHEETVINTTTTTTVYIDRPTVVTDSPTVYVTSQTFKKVAVVAVVGLCVLVASVFLVSLILWQRKRMRRRRNKKMGRKGAGAGHIPEETELQPQGPFIRGSPNTQRDMCQVIDSHHHFFSVKL